jgi:putative two-component system response regulator
MDGYEMVKLIRQEENVRMTPIIGITASDPAEIKVTGFLKLCDAFLHKPFMQHEVVEKVSSLLSRTVLTI